MPGDPFVDPRIDARVGPSVATAILAGLLNLQSAGEPPRPPAPAPVPAVAPMPAAPPAPSAGPEASRSPTTEPIAHGFDPVAAGLEATSRRFDSLGFQLHLPSGATAVPERATSGPSILIEDRPSASTWSIRVQVVQSPLTAPTAREQVEDQQRRLKASGTPYRVIQDRAVAYRGALGHWSILEHEQGDRQKFVKGWLFMQTDPDRFLVFSLLTLPEHLDRAMKLLEASFATMEITSQRDLTLAREAMLERGRIHLSTLTAERLRGLIGTTRWMRLHRPDGNQEIGYHMVQVTEGPMGALDPDRPERNYQAAERVKGLLVTLQGRLAVDPASNHYVDWIGKYWLAWDLSSEAWSVRATHRRSGAETSEAETGIRDRPDPRPRLTVIRGRGRSAQRTPLEWSLPDVYLPQALTLLMGDLPPPLIDGGDEVALAFYSYDGRDEQPAVSLRFDRWRDLGRAAGWEHSHMSANDVTPTVTRYGSDGRFIESRGPDGVMITPIEPEALAVLWKARGLRLGGERR